MTFEQPVIANSQGLDVSLQVLQMSPSNDTIRVKCYSCPSIRYIALDRLI